MMLFGVYLLGVSLGFLAGLLCLLREIEAQFASIDAQLAEWGEEATDETTTG